MEVTRNDITITSDGTPNGTKIFVGKEHNKVEISNLVISMVLSFTPIRVVANISLKPIDFIAENIRARIFSLESEEVENEKNLSTK